MPRNVLSPSPDLKSSQPIDPRKSQHQQYRPMPSSQSNSGSFVSLNEAAVINFLGNCYIFFLQFIILYLTRQQMSYPEWEEERLNLRHRSSSITGVSDWSAHPGYPRPGHQLPPQPGYPPPSRRAAGPVNSASAWDLTSAPSHVFPSMAPTRGMPMQQARICR